MKIIIFLNGLSGFKTMVVTSGEEIYYSLLLMITNGPYVW
jgi:hypothetical protein